MDGQSGSGRGVYLVVRGLLVATLLFVAWLKLAAFLGPIGQSRTSLTSQAAIPAVSILAGIAEIGAAVLLVTARARLGAWITFWLAFVFGVGFSYIVVAGLPTRACGCFGTWEAPVAAHYGIILSMMLLSRFVLIAAETERDVVAVGGAR